MPAPISGQLVLSSSAAPLVAFPVIGRGFTIRAPLTNTGPAYLGPAGVTSTTGHQLDPGDSLDYERTDQNGQVRYQLNVSDFYGVGNSGDLITWLVSP